MRRQFLFSVFSVSCQRSRDCLAASLVPPPKPLCLWFSVLSVSYAYGSFQSSLLLDPIYVRGKFLHALSALPLSRLARFINTADLVFLLTY
jgi:hypothetical protein